MSACHDIYACRHAPNLTRLGACQLVSRVRQYCVSDDTACPVSPDTLPESRFHQKVYIKGIVDITKFQQGQEKLLVMPMLNILRHSLTRIF